jgi:acyl carrier protein
MIRFVVASANENLELTPGSGGAFYQSTQRAAMEKNELIKLVVFNEIANLLEDKLVTVTDEMPLIESDIFDSMKLVELCLALEDKATELGFEFDWTSEATLSRSRSMFRSAGSLAAEFICQIELKK